MSGYIQIDGRKIGGSEPVYIVAEMSANHNQDFDRAAKIIRAAKEAGADAVKIQTYTPDTLTIDCGNDFFRIGKGTQWEGRTLYDLYNEAYTPWEWQPKLKALADDLGLDFFSTPFDATSVDFLERMGVPVYKIASFEMVDIPLIRRVAATGKPIIMSTGMAMEAEIQEAVQTAREGGCRQLALLKCTSAYPALPDEMNLHMIPHMAQTFSVPVGLSDHTLGNTTAIAAVSLGACVIEKHFTLSRSMNGPDSAFSIEPDEFRHMVDAIREVEKTLGDARYELTKNEEASRVFRRSLFVIKDVNAGCAFSSDNISSIRPGYGLHTRHLDEILGMRAAYDITRGTPLSWELIAEKKYSTNDKRGSDYI